jgi:hypothetical protein
VRVLAGMTALSFGCAPAYAYGTTAQPTAGVEPGVTIDEGSPAAKEYALALTQARRTGSGATGSHASSSEAPFGAGITPPASPGAGGGGSAGGTPTHSHARGVTPRATGAGGKARPSAPSLPAAVLRAGRTTSSGEDSVLALLGGGVAILVLGGLGGVILRHNRRPPSHA